MLTDLALIESRSVRDSQLANLSPERALETMNKAKALLMASWKGEGIATTRQMAEYYEVPEATVKSVIVEHRDELESDGLKVLEGKGLRDVILLFNLTSEGSDRNLAKAPSLTIWNPRAALRLGMVLKGSVIAQQVRTVLLDEATSETKRKKRAFVPFGTLCKKAGISARALTDLGMGKRTASVTVIRSLKHKANPDDWYLFEMMEECLLAELPPDQTPVDASAKLAGASSTLKQLPPKPTQVDTVRNFLDSCVQPCESTSPADCLTSAAFHGYYLEFCESFGHKSKNIQNFVSDLKAIAPWFYVERRRATVNEKRQGAPVNIPAYWGNLQIVPSTFHEGTNGNLICLRDNCKSGRLEQILEFVESRFNQ